MNNQTFEQLEILAPVVTRSGEGQYADLGDHRGYIVVSAAQTGNLFSLIDMEADFNAGPPPHIHTREDETFTIKTGRFAITVDGNTVEVGPGDAVFAPRNIPHTWRCISPEGGTASLLITPGANFEDFALQMSQHDIFPVTPESLPTLIELCESHGLELLPPA